MTANPLFTAVVLAGDRTATDPVAQSAGVCCKALTPVADRPMVLRVLDALADSARVKDRLLCGPPQDALRNNDELQNTVATGQVRWVENKDSPSRSALHAVMQTAKETPILLTTADHALLTSEIVDFFCERAMESDADVVIALAYCDEVSAAYPEVKRTALKFRDAAYCGCNLFAFQSPGARRAIEFWQQVETQRKKPWRIISALGWTSVLAYVMGWLTLDQALVRLSRRLNLRIDTVIMPFPEAAIDVDKVSDWELVQRLARGR